MKRRAQFMSEGSALVITLATLTLLAIIALALTASMRTARMSSRSFLEKTKASLLAEQGKNHAVALLREVCGTTNRFWAVRPGEGYTVAGTNGIPEVVVPLSTGLGTTTNDANLNIGSFTVTDMCAIVSTNVPLSVRWLYVYEDGSISSNAPATYNATNRVAGRYGFWVDTESSRINLNTASGRVASGPRHLTTDAVDLTVLTNMTRQKGDEIHAHVSTNRFFNAQEEIRELGVDPEAIKFETTHFNHDPEVTFWGAPRIVLTTQARLAGGRPYLDILRTANSDPGRMSAIDPAKLNTAIKMIVEYLGRKDWPVGPVGGNYGTKYFPGLPNQTEVAQRQLYQMAIHVIDYVRAKESSQEIVQKIVGRISGGNYQYTWSDDVNDVTSLSRAPLITEMGLYEQPALNSGTGTFWGEFKVEIFLPENYGLDSYDLSQLSAKVAWWHGWYNYFLTGTGPGEEVVSLHAGNVMIDGTTPGTILPKGHYAVLTVPVNLRLAGARREGDNAPFYLKAYLCTNPNDVGLSYVEEAPMITGYFNGVVGVVEYRVDPVGVTSANIKSVEVDDPRLNKHNGNWEARTSGNSFGVANSISTMGKAPLSLTAQQDVNESGMIAAESLYMPPPKGTAGNPEGRIISVAELGRVFTGGLGGYAVGVPWRTVRLQPSTASNILPDWAMLDLFAAPSDPNYVQDTSVRLVSGTANVQAGRINVNSVVAPFESGTTPAANLNRNAPLLGMLKGAALAVPAQYADVAMNIRQGVLADLGKNYSSAALTNRPVLLRGQLAEIRGVSDGGEKAETALADFIDLATTQAGVFRIYSIGQSLQQTKENAIKVTGEQRDCTLVERIVPASGAPEFRVLSQKDITF